MALQRALKNFLIKNSGMHQAKHAFGISRRNLSHSGFNQNTFLDTNKSARIELAAAYRIFERLGFNEGICNHLSLMAPAADGSGQEVMLLIPHGLHWKEVTASCLLGISSDGKVAEGQGVAEDSAFHIHTGVRSIHRHKCVFHLHTPYVTALTCLKDPTIRMCHQNAMRFRENIAYDFVFGGYGDNAIEGRRLAEKLGDKDILMMGNHGVLSAGGSVGEGFDSLYYLERIAMYQVLAMSTGRELSMVTDEAYNNSKATLDNMIPFMQSHFDAHVRMLQNECPEFAN